MDFSDSAGQKLRLAEHSCAELPGPGRVHESGPGPCARVSWPRYWHLCPVCGLLVLFSWDDRQSYSSDFLSRPTCVFAHPVTVL